MDYNMIDFNYNIGGRHSNRTVKSKFFGISSSSIKLRNRLTIPTHTLTGG
jgi:hypothetical protein